MQSYVNFLMIQVSYAEYRAYRPQTSARLHKLSEQCTRYYREEKTDA